MLHNEASDSAGAQSMGLTEGLIRALVRVGLMKESSYKEILTYWTHKEK